MLCGFIEKTPLLTKESLLCKTSSLLTDLFVFSELLMLANYKHDSVSENVFKMLTQNFPITLLLNWPVTAINGTFTIYLHHRFPSQNGGI